MKDRRRERERESKVKVREGMKSEKGEMSSSRCGRITFLDRLLNFSDRGKTGVYEGSDRN